MDNSEIKKTDAEILMMQFPGTNNNGLNEMTDDEAAAELNRMRYEEKYPGEKDNDVKDLIIHGLSEGAEQWKGEALEWKRKYELLLAQMNNFRY